MGRKTRPTVKLAIPVKGGKFSRKKCQSEFKVAYNSRISLRRIMQIQPACYETTSVVYTWYHGSRLTWIGETSEIMTNGTGPSPEANDLMQVMFCQNMPK
jgi:hypothetical protein